MRIVCPSCAAAYDVPEGLLTGRKAVRCARCSQEWRPAGAEALPVVAAPAAMSLARRPVIKEAPGPSRRGPDLGASAIDRLMATPQPKSGPRVALLLAWLVSLVLVAGPLGAAYVERSTVMALWPPSIRLYAALGLAGTPP